jgi:hypothetical protein
MLHGGEVSHPLPPLPHSVSLVLVLGFHPIWRLGLGFGDVVSLFSFSQIDFEFLGLV